MNVTFVTQPFDIVVPFVGGSTSIPILTYQMARHLPAQTTIFGRTAPHHPNQQQEEGIQYQRIDTRLDNWLLKPFKWWEQKGWSQQPLFAHPYFHRHYIQQVSQQINQAKIIHLHNFSQFAPVLKRAHPQAKLVLHMHCEWLTQLPKTIIAKRLESVNLVLGCSDYICQTIQTTFPHIQCKTLPNGVDVERFTPPPNKMMGQTILFAGRVSPEKGVHVLVEAFNRVHAQFPQAKLIIAGQIVTLPQRFIIDLSDAPQVQALTRFYDGNTYEQHLRAQLTPSAREAVTFVGFTPHNEMPQWFQKADILVNPSLSEAFGMSLIEAGAAGIPVIGARVGGMTNLVQEGKTGVLVEPTDSEALAKAICTLLADPPLRQAMGQAGQTAVRAQYTWQTISQQLMGMYEELLHA